MSETRLTENKYSYGKYVYAGPVAANQEAWHFGALEGTSNAPLWAVLRRTASVPAMSSHAPIAEADSIAEEMVTMAREGKFQTATATILPT